MLCCCSCFPPPDLFLPYLKDYLKEMGDDAITSMYPKFKGHEAVAQRCIRRLQVRRGWGIFAHMRPKHFSAYNWGFPLTDYGRGQGPQECAVADRVCLL